MNRSTVIRILCIVALMGFANPVVCMEDCRLNCELRIVKEEKYTEYGKSKFEISLSSLNLKSTGEKLQIYTNSQIAKLDDERPFGKYIRKKLIQEKFFKSVENEMHYLNFSLNTDIFLKEYGLWYSNLLNTIDTYEKELQLLNKKKVKLKKTEYNKNLVDIYRKLVDIYKDEKRIFNTIKQCSSSNTSLFLNKITKLKNQVKKKSSCPKTQPAGNENISKEKELVNEDKVPKLIDIVDAKDNFDKTK